MRFRPCAPTGCTRSSPPSSCSPVLRRLPMASAQSGRSLSYISHDESVIVASLKYAVWLATSTDPRRMARGTLAEKRNDGGRGTKTQKRIRAVEFGGELIIRIDGEFANRDVGGRGAIKFKKTTNNSVVKASLYTNECSSARENRDEFRAQKNDE